MYISPGVSIFPHIMQGQAYMPQTYIPFTIGNFYSTDPTEQYFEKLAGSQPYHKTSVGKIDVPGFSKVNLDKVLRHLELCYPQIFWIMMCYGIPYPLARQLLRDSIVECLRFLAKHNKD